MIAVILYALPLAVLFMTMSDQWTLDGFIVGYLVGVGVTGLIGDMPVKVNLRRLPAQLYWLTVYVVRLAWDILFSGFDVARRVLDPRLPINPGDLVVSTQDKEGDVVLAALSAHAITVTPGEMVEDFIEENGEIRMVVHTLDVDATCDKIDGEQTRRLSLLHRITLKGDKTT